MHMRVPLACMILILQMVLALTSLSRAQTAKGSSWEILNHVTHRRTYTFVDRRGKCTEGEIMATSDRAVTLKVWRDMRGERPQFGKFGTVTLDRANILRVLDGTKPVDVVYSSTSSWADVRALEEIGEDEGVLVVTRDGKRHKGKFLKVGAHFVELTYWGRGTKIRKEEISEVYYIREAPLSASAEYAAQEAVFIDPELWLYVLHIPPKIRVRLYDASQPEDDSAVGCPDRRWFGQEGAN
jgi:hypothetical protein